MKIIGITEKSLQYVYFKLKDKLELAFPEDTRDCDVLICLGVEDGRKELFNYIRNKKKCKVLLFLDYELKLKNVRGIQILKDIPDAFITYVKTKCTYGYPTIHLEKDSFVMDKIENISEDSFFTKYIYPLIFNGIKDKSYKKEILQAITASIKEVITKDSTFTIEKYKDILKTKYLKNFVNWLKTEEAKKVCECLLSKTIKYNFDGFEINYLLNYNEDKENVKNTAEP